MKICLERFFNFGAAVSASLWLVFIFSCTSPHEGKVKITFWHAMGGSLGTTLDSLVEEFNRTHPDIYIQATSVGNYGAMSQKLMASVMAQKPPVISQVFESWTDQFRRAGVIVPLNKYVHSSQGFSPEEIEDFFPAIWDDNMWDDTLWSLPFNKSLPVMFYNLDAFDSLGYEFPVYWEDFLVICSTYAYADPEKFRYVMGLPINTWMFETMLIQLNGQIIDPRSNQVEFDREPGINALNMLIDLIEGNPVAYLSTGYEHQDEFIAGRAIMAWGSVVSYSFMRKKEPTFNIAVAPLPYPREGRPAFVISGTNVAIFSHSTPEQQAAAWEFIKWFNSPQVQAQWSVNTGYIPTRRSSLQDSALRAHLELIPGMLNIYLNLDQAVSEPKIGAWFAGRIFLSEALEYTLRGVLTPQESLFRAAQKLRHEMRQY
ncbi:MAG: hypothetical protein APR63_08540 [Desulfuromonas sp. SDB]|nr:MAG: hypothetical protein APR63_08540 [Desulfuromonas sp. SDB]